MSEKTNDFIDQYQAFVRDGVEAWARQFDPKAGPAVTPSPDIVGRLFSGLDGYGDWLRSVMGGQAPTSPFGMGTPPFGQAAPGAPSFGFGPPPGAQPGTERFDDWAKVAREALSLPAFGITREQQEEQQALLRAWIDYAEQYTRYQTLLQGVHDRASEALRHQQAPTDADSMRSLYDRWVNLAEESYAQAALSAEFREVYAALVNAQMRLKLLQQRQIERLSAQAGMPTRKEVDSLGERLQAMRRELRQMQGLAAEVEALKAEIATLRAKPAKAPTKTAAPKKAAVAKKATRKTATRKTSR
ncbi:MAG: Poly(3-hydroxyalkanoate) polymerase subunit PhaE [Luteibacter sp.]|uniref:poly(R)-hydroxyalkanoic acid synthase subunit PhaE n=1 Tax=Luteibacter sp. TaxID=1886636 RepID=UPI0013818332|nr:poly(R)-hydroxyalkanoic acid synthase subunit PhaE [Luteibacter sp.]KAF1008576.1 MAG: Poly(3-hydroxyalkanoate) polymerase subunit PhaE [Luteibacter sp.]